MEYIYNNMRGDMIIKYIIRRAIENKKHFVIDIYFDGREYPNIISGRFKSLKNARQAMGVYNTNGIIPCGDSDIN